MPIVDESARTVLVAAPTRKVLTLEEAKDWLVRDETDDDADIDLIIDAAIEDVEAFTRRKLITQTHDLYLDYFPRDNRPIEIPFAPLQSITSVLYTDTAGTASTTFASTKYVVDTASEPGRIGLASGEIWPSTYDEINVVTIRYICGYGGTPDTVPAKIKARMKMLIAELYTHREIYLSSRLAIKLDIFDRLFADLRVYTF